LPHILDYFSGHYRPTTFMLTRQICLYSAFLTVFWIMLFDVVAIEKWLLKAAWNCSNDLNPVQAYNKNIINYKY
jgi:hypothetical protein